MKRHIAAAMLFFTIGAFAETNTVRTQLCDYWKHDFQSNSYTCNWLGMYVNLVEANDYQRTIQELERRIQNLESRLNKLESK